MPARVFISYDHDDANQVNGFRSLGQNPNHPLEFQDRSLAEPVRDKADRIIRYPPTDPRAEPVRRAIRERFDQCSRLVVLIGDDTHSSAWVDWEIEEFHRRKTALGYDASRRIRGMRLKGSRGGGPAALRGRSMPTLEWNPTELDRWLDTPV